MEQKLNELKKMAGSQYSVLDFSNKLQALGLEDICNFGNLDEVLESGSVIAMYNSNESYEIYLEIINKSEDILNWEIEITNVELY